MLHDLRGYEFERKALRANNLRPKEKQLNVVFATVDTAEQGVGRAECIEAKADDYANGAVGRELQIPHALPRKYLFYSPYAKRDSIVEIVSAMEFCFIYVKCLIFPFNRSFRWFPGGFSFINDKSALLCPT